MSEAFEQLGHDAFDMGFRERALHVIQQTSQILLAVFHHQKNAMQFIQNIFLTIDFEQCVYQSDEKRELIVILF